jgi:putative methionine-R-sulfoxide reductase with GAF domain
MDIPHKQGNSQLPLFDTIFNNLSSASLIVIVATVGTIINGLFVFVGVNLGVGDFIGVVVCADIPVVSTVLGIAVSPAG